MLAELAPTQSAEAYLCGPAPFMDEISAGLVAVGLAASHIHTEPFGPAPSLTPGIAQTPTRSPHLPAGRPGRGPTIEFARSSLAVPWSSEYGSLLEFAEACDVPVRWSCRTGVCHNCEICRSAKAHCRANSVRAWPAQQESLPENIHV